MHRLCLLLCLLPVIFSPPAASAQTPAPESPVRGIYNWIHSSGDAARAFAFYQRVLGFTLERSTFAGPSSAASPPPEILPAALARSDELVWDLTDTQGSRFRTVFMHAGNVPYGFELSEFFDIARNRRASEPWDPGSSSLVFSVRDLDDIVSRLRAFGAPVVTPGGVPVQTAAGRSILVRDPDGYLVEVRQASPVDMSRTAGGAVIAASIRITVADTARALGFYRDLLGFDAGTTQLVAAADMQVFGLDRAEMMETVATIAGTQVNVIFTQFTLPADFAPAAHAYDWQFQDVGAPQFQLQVVGLDELLAKTAAAGYRLHSIGGRPIQRPFGRFVFVRDPDGVFVEYVEPASP